MILFIILCYRGGRGDGGSSGGVMVGSGGSLKVVVVAWIWWC